jgi:hypothetical protein
MDPVSWETIEAVVGPPAPEVEAYVDGMGEDLRDEAPYDAVKAVHDALARDLGEERTPAGQGEVFLVAYLLERAGVVSPGGRPSDDGVSFPSVAERRPDGDRLRELFWGRERTMWWLGIRLGVHWALVRYWLYEEEIPLRERNFPAETTARIRAYRERDG